MGWFRRTKKTDSAPSPRRAHESNVARRNEAKGKPRRQSRRPPTGPISNDEFITRYGDPFD